MKDQHQKSSKKHIQIIEINPTQGIDHDIHKQVKPIQHDGVVSTAGKVGKSHTSYLKVMNEHKKPTHFRPVTLQQLSHHKTADSAWLSFRGIVYDATTYLKFHPGGKKLLQGCGKQCDELFNSYHPWVNAEYLLQTYKIGHLKR